MTGMTEIWPGIANDAGTVQERVEARRDADIPERVEVLMRGVLSEIERDPGVSARIAHRMKDVWRAGFIDLLEETCEHGGAFLAVRMTEEQGEAWMIDLLIRRIFGEGS